MTTRLQWSSELIDAVDSVSDSIDPSPFRPRIMEWDTHSGTNKF